MPESRENSSPAVAFAVYAALAYEIIAAVNSSPQTTEINAAARAPTLMKWVKIAMLQLALFGGIGVTIEWKHGRPVWPVAGGVALGGALLYWQYVYAANCGLKSAAPGTEDYGTGVNSQ